MNDFADFKRNTRALRNFLQAFVQIRHGNFTSMTVFNLHDKNRIERFRLLLVDILSPMLAFIFPFVSRRLKNRHIFCNGSSYFLIGINDHYSFLQQAGIFDFVVRHNDAMNCRRALLSVLYPSMTAFSLSMSAIAPVFI